MSRATLLDVAKAVNLSKTTVSMVLNNKPINVAEETRARIFKAAEELNYVPNSLARNLSTNKTYTIGFVVPDIQNPFFSEMAKSIEREAERMGYSIILCNTFNRGEKEIEYVTLLIGKLVDGVIMVPSGETSRSIELLTHNNIPFVLIDRGTAYTDQAQGIFSDSLQGIELGIQYLVNHGHQHIAFVSGEEKGMSHTRVERFEQLASRYGVFHQERVAIADFSLEGGINGTKALMEKGISIDAIFYGSDVMAIGGMKYLLQHGYKIPEDISILGYDNIAISSFVEPELTTVAQPISKMGEEAMHLLMKKIDGKAKDGESITLELSLVERRTVRTVSSAE